MAVKSGLCTFRYVPSSRRNAWQSRSGIFRHVVARRLTQGSLGTARRGWLGYRNARQSGRVRSGLCLARQVGLAQRSQGAARMVMSGFGNARQSWSGPDGTACPGSVTQGSHGRHVTFRRVPSRQRKAVRSRQGPARTGPSSRVIATQGSQEYG